MLDFFQMSCPVTMNIIKGPKGCGTNPWIFWLLGDASGQVERCAVLGGTTMLALRMGVFRHPSAQTV